MYGWAPEEMHCPHLFGHYKVQFEWTLNKTNNQQCSVALKGGGALCGRGFRYAGLHVGGASGLYGQTPAGLQPRHRAHTSPVHSRSLPTRVHCAWRLDKLPSYRSVDVVCMSFIVLDNPSLLLLSTLHLTGVLLGIKGSAESRVMLFG